MKKECCFIIFILLFCSCSNRKNTITDESIVIDVEALSSNLDVATLVDSISYIVLNDSSNDAVFSEISKCQIYDGCIYILDFMVTKTVKVFKMNGDYLFTVGKKGNGPGEFIRVMDFDVNSSGIYTLDRSLRKISHFSLTGEFIDERSYLEHPYVANGFAVTNNNSYILGMDKEKRYMNSSDKLLLVDSEFNTLKCFESFSEDDTEGYLKLDAVKRCGENIVFHYPVSDLIYVFDTFGKKKEILNINLGGKDIPEKLRRNFEDLENDNENRNFIYFYDTPFVNDRYILSVVSYHSAQALFLLDRYQKKYFLNVYDKYYDIQKMLFPVFANNEIVVCYLNQYLYERTKNVMLSKEQLDYLEEGGTILVIYYLKK